MAPRREMKDDRHLRPTRITSPVPKQKKRASSVPTTTGSNKMECDGMHQTKMTASYYAVRKVLSAPPSSYYSRSRSLSPRATTKNTKPVICKRGFERTVVRLEWSQMELCKRLERMALGGLVMDDAWGEAKYKGKENAGMVDRESEMMDLDEGNKMDVEGDVAMD